MLAIQLCQIAMLDRTDVYCKYYTSQAGGEIPIFRGGQHGAGLGDVLRGILRFIAPIALRGLSTFASSTLQARQNGATFKDAAMGALKPTLGAMGQSFQEQQSAASQRGKGIRHLLSRQSGNGVVRSTLFSGEHGVPFDVGDVYKSRLSSGVKRKHKRTGKKRTAKRSRSSSPDNRKLNF